MSTRRMAWMFSAVAVCFGVATLPAATNTWTGGAGGSGTSWNDPSSWDSGKVPASVDEAAFNAAATQNKTVTLDASQSVLQLRMSGAPTNLILGGASDVSAGNTLTLGTVLRDATAQTQTIAAAVVVAPNRGSTTWNVANAAGLLIDAGTIGAKGAVFEKTGSGTLLLNGNNAFGDVVGSGGTLTLNGNNTLSNLTVNGATIYLPGANSLSGVSALGGTLVLSNANALGSSGAVRFGGGVLRLFDTTDLSGRFSQEPNQYYSVDMPTNVTFATPLTSVGGSLSKKGNGTLRLPVANSYTGPTTLNAGVLTISGAGTLGSSTSPLTLASGTLDLGGTVQTVGGVNVTGSTTVSNGTLNATSYTVGAATPSLYCSLAGPGAALVKNGNGMLNLYGANSYTGDTTISGSTMQLLFTASTSPVNDVINSASALKLAGSTVQVNGKSTVGSQNRQTVNGLYINAPGASSLIIVNGSSSGNTLLSLGTITRQPGATVNFSQPAVNTTVSSTNGYTTATANDASGILGGWATVGSTPTDWAANNGTNIVAFTNYLTLTGNTPTIANGMNSNVRVSNASTGTVSLAASGTTTINTLLDKDAAARTNLVGVGNTLRLGAAGGILVTGAGALTIDQSGSAGTLTAGGADNTPGDLVINNTSTVSNNAVIADNGSAAVSLTKVGNGNLFLTRACTHTGGTWVNAGALYLPGVANALATNSPIMMLSAGPLDLGGGTLTNRVGVALHNASCVLTNGTLALFGTNLDVWGGTITATLAGSGGLLKTTSNTLLLSNTVNNTYTGDTIVREGTLTLGSEYALGGSTNVVVGAPGGGPTVVTLGRTAINAYTPYKAGKSYTIYPNGYVDFTGYYGGGWLSGTLTIIGGSLNSFGYMTIQSGASVKMTGGTFAGTVQNNPPSADYDITTYATNAAAIISAAAYSLRTVTVARGTAPIDVTFSGSTVFRLIKAGPGVMTITTGLTNSSLSVAAGTLLVNNYMSFNTSGTGQGPVTNAIGATLGGLGTIGGVAGYSNANVVLASATTTTNVATLAPGNIDAITGNHVIGTLTVGSAIQTNNVTFGKYGRLYVTLGSAPPLCDCLAVNGAINLGDANNSAILDVAAGSTMPRAGNYTVASFNVLTGRFQMVRSAAGVLPAHYAVNYLGTPSGRGNEMLNGSIVVSLPQMGTAIMVQ